MGAIQTFARKEIKFLLTEQQYQDFLPLLEHYMNPDKFCVGGKEYGIYNVYYDTPDDFLIRESLEKPDYNEKIRLRRHSRRTLCFWKSKRRSAALSTNAASP